MFWSNVENLLMKLHDLHFPDGFSRTKCPLLLNVMFPSIKHSIKTL